MPRNIDRKTTESDCHPNPSLVLGGVCRYATAALLMSIYDGILSTVTLALFAWNGNR